MSGFLKAGSGKREVGLKLNLWAGFGMGGKETGAEIPNTYNYYQLKF